MVRESSTSNRIISATFANWMGIIANIVIQIALVPVYLSYWSTDTYGLWLIFLSIWGFFLIIYNGYQIFVGFEVIKIAKNKAEVNNIISSTSIVTNIIALFLIVMGFVFWNYKLGLFLGLTVETAIQLGEFLIIYSVAWLLSGSLHGIFEKWLVPYGFTPYFSWFRTIRLIFSNIVAVTVVINGGDIYQAILYMAFADVTLFWLSSIFLIKALKDNDLVWSNQASLRIGLNYFRGGLYLVFTAALNASRNIGLRILIAPTLNLSEIAQFSTLRTPSNIVMQGINSITYSLQPELSASLRDKEINKVFIFNTFVWLVVSTLVIPFLLVLQFIMPPFFELWTLGKIEFQGNTFAIFSIIVGVYALYIPLEAIIKGNNLVKKQLFISIVAVAVLILCIYLLVPSLKLLGAALALLIVEVVVLFLYLIFSFNWLNNFGFKVPYLPFLIAFINLFIAAVDLYSMTIYVDYRYELLLFGSISTCIFSYLAWYFYPLEIKKYLKTHLLLKVKIWK